ncbi:MAG: amidohydrolase family protein [Asgard group archaeon]|nr:amidohydrolase family protein [Asgard group archaeon]
MGKNDKRLIVKNGNVFDSLTGKIKKNTTIVISGKQIVWVGDDGSFEKEKNDQVIKAEGKTILPGLVESHVHLASTCSAQSERVEMRTKTTMWHYIALNNAQKHLASGFTCVRDCGASPGWIPSLRRILDMGVFAGPRLVVADNGVAQWGNQEMIGPQYVIDYYKNIGEVKAGVDGVIHAVRQRKSAGADFIKTLTTGGVLHGMESKLGTSLFLDEELEAMVKEAERIGMHVASHAHGLEGIYKAVKAGIHTIEHGSFLDEETADLMVKKDSFLVPTQMALAGLLSDEILQQLPPEVQIKTKETGIAQKKAHKIAFERGVKIAVGTDAGTPGNFHGTTGTEIKYMVENVGMTPAQALQAATIVGAKCVHLDDKIGVIEKGKMADIVISNKNPLEDISVVENPKNFSHVIKDGKIMVEKGVITYFSP